MLLGADIALFVIGLALVVQGRFNLTKTLVVSGIPARVVGVIAMTPWPLTEVLAWLTQVMIGMTASSSAQSRFKITFLCLQLGLLIGSAIAAYAVALRYARNLNRAEAAKPLELGPE